MPGGDLLILNIFVVITEELRGDVKEVEVLGGVYIGTSTTFCKRLFFRITN